MITYKNRFSLTILTALLIFSCNNEKEKIQVEKSVSPTHSFFKVEGKNILDRDGNPVILKGTNLGHWLMPEGYMFKMDQVNSPRKIDELLYELVGPDSLQTFWKGFLENYITHEDIKYLKQIGSNHIRVPFHYKLFTQDIYLGERNIGFRYLDKLVDWCREENLYILLDMHAAPGGQTGDNIDDSYGYPYLLRSKSSQDLMTEIWVDIAEHYKDEPIILGYDIVNEPVAHYFQDELDELNPLLFQLYERIVKEIRQVDPDHTIFLNGSIWSGNFDVFENKIDENIVYEFHKYWFEVNQESVQTYLDFSEEWNAPIYIGETGENTDQWVEDFRMLLYENKISWCFWPYKKMNNTRGIMNFEEPENYSLISDYAKADRSSYEATRKNRPDVIEVQKALNEFVKNCNFTNCFENTGYVTALGFNSTRK